MSSPSTSVAPAPWPSDAAAALVAIAVLVAGCGPGRSGSLSAPGPGEVCIGVPAAERGGGVEDEESGIEVGLSRPVDPRAAPVPRNPDEALVFRLLYEPLIRLDCNGLRYPGLAASWRASDSGRRWTFALREDARFQDGEPVTARDVVARWTEVERTGRVHWGPFRPLSVEAVDDRRVAVVFPEPLDEVPPILADPALSVVRPGSDPAWPLLGSGPYRVVEVGAEGAGRGQPGAPARFRPGRAGDVTFLELAAGGRGAGVPPTLRFRVAESGDLRDLLDAGTEMVITDDPGTLAYARLRPRLFTFPLPWSRTYILVVPRDPARDAEPSLPTRFLEALAADVVRGEARPASSHFGPTGGSPGHPTPTGCVRSPDRAEGTGRHASGQPVSGLEPARPSPPSRARRIVYPRDDPTARALAERLVALSTVPSGSAGPAADFALRALGLDSSRSGFGAGLVAIAADRAELPEAIVPGVAFGDRNEARREGEARTPTGLRGERASMYVLGVPRTAWDPCPPGGRAPETGIGPDPPPTVTHRIVPLVETRRRIVARPLPVPVMVDGDGIPFFHPPGRP